MASKKEKLVDQSGKIIGVESNLLNLGFNIDDSLKTTIKQYLQIIKNQPDPDNFEIMKSDYYSLFPKKMNKETCIEFTDLVVHDKQTQIFDEDLKKLIILSKFWDYIKIIKEKLNTYISMVDLRNHILKQITNLELRTIILKETFEVAIDSLLTEELQIKNLLIEAIELGTTDKQIHEEVLEKIWKDPTIKECYQIGSTEKTIIEKYLNSKQ